jgi:hypothetical protein
MVSLRVFALTGRAVCRSSCASFSPLWLYCHVFISNGGAPKGFGIQSSPSYLAQQLAGLQLAAVMRRIRIIKRCTRGGSPPQRYCGEFLLHIASYGPWLFLNLMMHPHLGEKKLCIATALALDRSAYRRSKRGIKPRNTRRSRLSLNGDPSLCAALNIAGGVSELFQRRSAFVCNRSAVQTTTP